MAAAKARVGGTLADRLKVARLRADVRSGPVERLFEREETTTRDALRRRWGFSDAFVDAFFRPFVGGITLDPELQTSSRMFAFVFRMFAEGHAALPAAGMGALPAQLAAGLPETAILHNARVTSVQDGRVTVENGGSFAARAVVARQRFSWATALDAYDGRSDQNAPSSSSISERSVASAIWRSGVIFGSTLRAKNCAAATLPS